MKLTNTMEEKWKFLLAIKREFESIIWSVRSRPPLFTFRCQTRPDRFGSSRLQGRSGLANFPLPLLGWDSTMEIELGSVTPII